MTAAQADRPQPFQFDFTRIVAHGPTDIWVAGYRGWIVAPQPWLADGACDIIDLPTGRRVARQSMTHVDNPFWARQQLGIARYHPPAEGSAGPQGHLLAPFWQALMDEEVRLINAAAEWCQAFLAARTIGQQTLLAHPAVAQMVGHLVRDVYAINVPDRSALTTPAQRRWWLGSVDAVAEQLIKLAGGRAMLSGQMVYLRTLFLLLNRLYLEV